METTKPLFEIGEVAILQPPHPSAKAYWGMETTILNRKWSADSADAFSGNYTGWNYLTDISAPPPTDDPADQTNDWVWCEYDLRKKYDAGKDFESLMDELDEPIETEVEA